MADKITHYRFRNPQEIFALAHELSYRFPSHRNVMIGIYELLLNAVEHGNLEMRKEEKADLLKQGRFAQEMSRRLALAENIDKYVEIGVAEDNHFSHLHIRDHGNGFDWKTFMNAVPDEKSPHGRGLLIARECGFHQLSFNNIGNTVTCIMKQEAALAPATHDPALRIRKFGS